MQQDNSSIQTLFGPISNINQEIDATHLSIEQETDYAKKLTLCKKFLEEIDSAQDKTYKIQAISYSQNKNAFALNISIMTTARLAYNKNNVDKEIIKKYLQIYTNLITQGFPYNNKYTHAIMDMITTLKLYDIAKDLIKYDPTPKIKSSFTEMLTPYIVYIETTLQEEKKASLTELIIETRKNITKEVDATKKLELCTKFLEHLNNNKETIQIFSAGEDYGDAYFLNIEIMKIATICMNANIDKESILAYLLLYAQLIQQGLRHIEDHDRIIVNTILKLRFNEVETVLSLETTKNNFKKAFMEIKRTLINETNRLYFKTLMKDIEVDLKTAETPVARLKLYQQMLEKVNKDPKAISALSNFNGVDTFSYSYNYNYNLMNIVNICFKANVDKNLIAEYLQLYASLIQQGLQYCHGCADLVVEPIVALNLVKIAQSLTTYDPAPTKTYSYTNLLKEMLSPFIDNKRILSIPLDGACLFASLTVQYLEYLEYNHLENKFNINTPDNMRQLICDSLKAKITGISKLVAEFLQQITADEILKKEISKEQLEKLNKHQELTSFTSIGEIYVLLTHDLKNLLSKQKHILFKQDQDTANIEYEKFLKSLEFIYNLSLDLQFGGHPYKDFNKYIDAMRKSEWGGAPEITIASEIFSDAKIIVYEEDPKKGKYDKHTIKEIDKPKYEINLLHISHVGGKGFHYNLLVDPTRFSTCKNIQENIKKRELENDNKKRQEIEIKERDNGNTLQLLTLYKQAEQLIDISQQPLNNTDISSFDFILRAIYIINTETILNQENEKILKYQSLTQDEIFALITDLAANYNIVDFTNQKTLDYWFNALGDSGIGLEIQGKMTKLSTEKINTCKAIFSMSLDILSQTLQTLDQNLISTHLSKALQDYRNFMLKQEQDSMDNSKKFTLTFN